MAKAPQTNEDDDDFVNHSERPYTDMSRGSGSNGGLLDQYLRPQVLIPAFILGIGLLALLYYLGVFQVIGVLVASIFLLVLAVVIIAYLDNSLTAESANLLTHIDLSDWRTIRAAINNQKNKSAQVALNQANSDSGDEDDDIYGNDLSPHFGGKTPQQQLEESLEDAKLQIVNTALQAMKTDIFSHIDNQRRNSNMLLVLAIMIGLVGTSVLVAASLNTAEAYYFSMTQCGMALVTLLFVVVFLTQYSSTQQRIKFFQNELTNLNARISAFQLAYLLEEKDAVNEIIRDLTRTERNFKMGKNDQLP